MFGICICIPWSRVQFPLLALIFSLHLQALVKLDSQQVQYLVKHPPTATAIFSKTPPQQLQGNCKTKALAIAGGTTHGTRGNCNIFVTRITGLTVV